MSGNIHSRKRKNPCDEDAKLFFVVLNYLNTQPEHWEMFSPSIMSVLEDKGYWNTKPKQLSNAGRNALLKYRREYTIAKNNPRAAKEYLKELNRFLK